TMRFNLVDPLPAAVRSAQIVFCRNVLIYVSPDEAGAFLDRVADSLGSNTVLFLGAAETMWPYTERFRAMAVEDTFVYRQMAPRLTRETPRATPPRAPRPVVACVSRPRTSLVLVDAPSDEVDVELASTVDLMRAGQDAFSAGEFDAAVIAFRKWTYLA